MLKRITYSEYKRRVFNTALLECFCKIHGQVLNGACENDEPCDERMTDMANRLCRTFMNTEMALECSTISQTKARLSESSEFMKDCGDVCEDIAEKKCKDASDNKVEVTDGEVVELSQEDKALINQLFDTKGPTPQVDRIRDATVAALVAEDKKAAEIKQAVDIAQSKVASGENPKALEETVKRLNRVGPTSLMNAIMNNVSAIAVKDINESGNFTSVGKVMQENADEIKTRAVAIYALYETLSVFGLKKYTPADVKQLATEIFYEK